jgi:hypothetical protein
MRSEAYQWKQDKEYHIPLEFFFLPFTFENCRLGLIFNLPIDLVNIALQFGYSASHCPCVEVLVIDLEGDEFVPQLLKIVAHEVGNVELDVGVLYAR